MKTFETEKNYIPEGATHYSEEQLGAYFCWYIISSDDAEIAVLDGVGFGLNWHACEHGEQFGDNVKPIPQTNIETPEEKVAFDSIDSNLIKPREPSNPVITKVEWGGSGLPAVGVECEAVFIEHEHKGYGKFLILGYHDNYVWMEYIGDLSNKSKHYTAKVDMVEFRKPETEAERVEREREENGKAFYEKMSDIEVSVMNPDDSEYPAKWHELREEWKEVYMRQAERIEYRKESE